jgi:hypothetical protein
VLQLLVVLCLPPVLADPSGSDLANAYIFNSLMYRDGTIAVGVCTVKKKQQGER